LDGTPPWNGSDDKVDDPSIDHTSTNGVDVTHFLFYFDGDDDVFFFSIDTTLLVIIIIIIIIIIDTRTTTTATATGSTKVVRRLGQRMGRT